MLSTHLFPRGQLIFFSEMESRLDLGYQASDVID
jgi:hypothetical protein